MLWYGSCCCVRSTLPEQKEEPNAMYIHCLAHFLNLCLHTVTKSVLPVKEALDLAMELETFIEFSPKRSHLFSALQQQLSPNAPSIKMLCLTQCTVRTGALEAIIKNYKVLLETILDGQNSGKDEYTMKAAGFLQPLDKFSTYYGLKLSHQLQNIFQPCFNQKTWPYKKL